jgi:peptidyl-tRNA hydrolase, PTH1 family
MFCVVGLGNPDIEYQRNRHNIGFMVADEIVRRYGLGQPSKKYSSQLHECKADTHKFFVQKPQTYMNRSGIAVSALCSFYKIMPQNIIVIHDDLDLEPFDIRVKQAGGHGGHNGLKSIDSFTGQNYIRIRIGIGRPADKEMVTSWVLGDFKKNDNTLIETISDAIAIHLPIYFSDGLSSLRDAIQKKYHSKLS